jgi:hypothetical protein
MESLSKMKQCSVTSTTREHWNHHDKRARGPPRRADTTKRPGWHDEGGTTKLGRGHNEKETKKSTGASGLS